MSRWRAALPLILLVLAGIVLFASGSLDQLSPQQLVAHQNELRAQIAEHPWLSHLVSIGLLTLTVATGLPGTIVVILAGGFAFGVVDATLCSSLALILGSLILFLASRYAFGPGSRKPPARKSTLAATSFRLAWCCMKCSPASAHLKERRLPASSRRSWNVRRHRSRKSRLRRSTAC